jgi:eukaryotic-like serine/threonine-protein kinase
VLEPSGRLSEAQAAFLRARAIYETLVAKNPKVARLRRDLAWTLNSIGGLLTRSGRSGEALAPLRQAESLLAALMKDEPANDDYAALLATTRSLLPAELYDHAATHARLGALASVPGSNVTAALGAAELDRAMDALRRAVANGYRDLPRFERDPDLDTLRQRPDFRLLMLELAFPADPFARSG